MMSWLLAVALVAVVLREAHATRRCFLMASGFNVNTVFGPDQSMGSAHSYSGGNYWREVTNHGYGNAFIDDDYKVNVVGLPNPIGMKGSYNETKGCMVGGYFRTTENWMDGAVGLKPSSTEMERPKTYIFPVDAPIQPAFFGRLEGGVVTKISTLSFPDCYKYGVRIGATGVQWRPVMCEAHTGSDVRAVDRVSKVDHLPHKHYRSLLYEPITFYSTAEERIYLGVSAKEGVSECAKLAKEKNVEAKFVTWNYHSKKCYRATKGGLIPTFEDIDHTWHSIKVDIAGPPKPDSSTFNCKPKA